MRLFCSLARIFLRPDNSARVSVLYNTNYSVTSCSFKSGRKFSLCDLRKIIVKQIALSSAYLSNLKKHCHFSLFYHSPSIPCDNSLRRTCFQYNFSEFIEAMSFHAMLLLVSALSTTTTLGLVFTSPNRQRGLGSIGFGSLRSVSVRDWE